MTVRVAFIHFECCAFAYKLKALHGFDIHIYVYICIRIPSRLVQRVITTHTLASCYKCMLQCVYMRSLCYVLTRRVRFFNENAKGKFPLYDTVLSTSYWRIFPCYIFFFIIFFHDMFLSSELGKPNV